MKISSSLKATVALTGAMLVAGPAQAVVIGLYDWGINIDGTVVGALPAAGVSAAGFNFTTGLGVVTVTIGAGTHHVSMFVDHEIDEEDNTFFNEYGGTSGSASVGQTWEIDEPGFLFGDIYDNFIASDNTFGSQLDDSNGVPAGSEDDVSMALGWDLTFAVPANLYVSFRTSLTDPGSVFNLSQTDPDSDETIYFWSTVSATPPDDGGTSPPGIPEPGTLMLLGAGFAGIGAMRRRPQAARR